MIAQKWMLDRANQLGKPSFVQSQVLESMVNNSACTRIEAEEISSCVLEGVDAIMLSHETAIGKNPIASVIQLAKSIAEAENVLDYD